MTNILQKCECIVYHPPLGTKEWAEVWSNFRQVADHGDGAILPIMAEQLFGECPSRTQEVA